MISIYALIDPRTNEIRYVGKTKYPLVVRLQQHINAKKQRRHVYYWLRVLWKNNRVPTIRLLEEVEDTQWQEAEQRWIAKIKTEGAQLTNHTIGGDGLSGYVMSEEHRRKIGIAHKGRIISQEQRTRISRSVKALFEKREYKERVIFHLRNKSPTTINKIRASNTGKIFSEEHKAKLSAALKRRWADPKQAAQMIRSCSQPRGPLSSAHKAKLSAVPKTEKQREAVRASNRRRKGVKHSSVSIQKMRDAAFLRWAKRKAKVL